VTDVASGLEWQQRTGGRLFRSVSIIALVLSSGCATAPLTKSESERYWRLAKWDLTQPPPAEAI
jgi:hypothetical protein